MQKSMFLTQIKIVNCYGFRLESAELTLNETLCQLQKEGAAIERITHDDFYWIIEYKKFIEVDENDTVNNG